jgi:hypothetical protein
MRCRPRSIDSSALNRRGRFSCWRFSSKLRMGIKMKQSLHEIVSFLRETELQGVEVTCMVETRALTLCTIDASFYNKPPSARAALVQQIVSYLSRQPRVAFRDIKCGHVPEWTIPQWKEDSTLDTEKTTLRIQQLTDKDLVRPEDAVLLQRALGAGKKHALARIGRPEQLLWTPREIVTGLWVNAGDDPLSVLSLNTACQKAASTKLFLLCDLRNTGMTEIKLTIHFEPPAPEDYKLEELEDVQAYYKLLKRKAIQAYHNADNKFMLAFHHFMDDACVQGWLDEYLQMHICEAECRKPGKDWRELYDYCPEWGGFDIQSRPEFLRRTWERRRRAHASLTSMAEDFLKHVQERSLPFESTK